MKKLAFLFLLSFISNLVSQQKYYTFSELKGMEDSSGNTHLYYRQYYSLISGNTYQSNNSIYHLDIRNLVDTLFLEDYDLPINGILRVNDYKFWNNDPSKFIYCGYVQDFDPVAFIQRFDEDRSSHPEMFSVDNIFISQQNDSLLFAGGSGSTDVSTDGGRSWDKYEPALGKQIVSLNPFNDSVLFFRDDNKLLKTTDRGISFSIVDTGSIENLSFLYDADKKHIYRTAYSNQQYCLFVSDNAGNAFSWVNNFASPSEIFTSLDNPESGNIYLANGKNIYFSNDFGKNFTLYKTLAGKIAGIFKKLIPILSTLLQNIICMN